MTSNIHLFSGILQINFNPSRFAACHLLSQNPGALAIVRFYHADRDIIRRSWLKGVTISLSKLVTVEECLAPRELRSRAKQLGLLSFTRKKKMLTANENDGSAPLSNSLITALVLVKSKIIGIVIKALMLLITLMNKIRLLVVLKLRKSSFHADERLVIIIFSLISLIP